MKSQKLIFVGGAMLSVMSACSPAKENRPLNIIYIMTDDHTQQAMGCYGYDYAKTPNNFIILEIKLDLMQYVMVK